MKMMTVRDVWTKIDTIQGYCDMINERKDFDDDSMDFINDLLCEYKRMLLNLKIENY
jgi:hypothetical protein